MSKVRRLLGQDGTSFSNFVVSTPGCSPSRASILRGQPPHTHGLWTGKGPEGGYSAFARTGLERSTVATWLQDRGYRTALVGKYLNEYGVKPETAKVPPGWDEWCAAPEIKYFDYDLIENDRVVHRGNKPEDYLTDVLSRKAITFLETAARSDKPFFLYLAPRAPHGPATPAPRYARAFGNAKVPRTDAFNEADVDDKPSYVHQSPRLRRKQIRTLDALHRDRLRTLQSVDKMVEDVLTTLRRTGTLDNTDVFFTSDNGFLLGQHRRADKGLPYEEAIRVPLLVRGPGVPSRVEPSVTSNIDRAPTLADLAGAATPDFVDGRSLVPLLRGETPSVWRTATLVERDRSNEVAIERGDIGGEPTTPAF
ncbi:MAG: sulfatase, partial [Geodermatophilaceae bacterium]|nr:sulfatase [Geodermatophilaceae bacterium]